MTYRTMSERSYHGATSRSPTCIDADHFNMNIDTTSN